MKKCTICKEEKTFDFFNKNKGKKDGFNNICRECSNVCSKNNYELNKEKHKELVKIRRVKVVAENRKKIYNYLLLNSCVDCGLNNPIVMDFDHKDNVDKRANVSEMSNLSWKTIEKEINKCDVRCANCHRIRTAKQFGWYKWLLD